MSRFVRENGAALAIAAAMLVVLALLLYGLPWSPEIPADL
jgi:hypothetical protein